MSRDAALCQRTYCQCDYSCVGDGLHLYGAYAYTSVTRLSYSEQNAFDISPSVNEPRDARV